MPFEKHWPEEIIRKLRKAEIVLAQVCRLLRRIDGSRLNSRPTNVGARNYGELKTDQVRQMKNLEKGNERLRRAISDLRA